MQITNIISRNKWTWIVVSSEAGKTAVTLGFAIEAAAGEEGREAEVIRTTKSCDLTNRKIDATEAREVLDFVAAKINESNREIAAEWNDCMKDARLTEIEVQIVEALQ